MKLCIDAKPLSVNKAWRGGRRFKTNDYIALENEISYLIGHGECPEGELAVLYIFYIRNYSRSDTANFEKVLSDILVKTGHLRDDRYIKLIMAVKRPTNGVGKIEAHILPYTEKNALALMREAIKQN